MKKFILLLFTAITSILVYPASAISLQEIKENPNYLLVGSTETTDLYTNINSVNVIRYTPPYYSINVIEESIDYTKSHIITFNTTYHYNFNDKVSTELHKQFEQYYISHDKTLTPPREDILKIGLTALQHSGISATRQSAEIYDFSGTLLYSSQTNTNSQVKVKSPGYKSALTIFKKVYKIDFDNHPFK